MSTPIEPRDILIEMAKLAYKQLQTAEERDHDSGGIMAGSVPTPTLVKRIYDNLARAGGVAGPAVEVTVLQPGAKKEDIEEALFTANAGNLDRIRELGKAAVKSASR